MIDLATQQKIKDTADIVDVVSDYVHLVRSGGGYKGLCPFHNERTPSFSVNRARNFCFCFSCKKGGSPVNFIMQKEGISYYEALRQLAKKYGIKIEEKEITDEERASMERKEAMYLANEWAMQLFEKNLHDTPDGHDIGLQYLYSRGVTEEAIKAFHIGYALDRSTAFIEEAKKKGFNLNLLKELGLIGTSQQGYDYDRFRGRIIFPIMSSSHKVVGFGGRTLKQEAAKYVNSPESEIYKKSYELYGMSQARQTIVSQDRCFLVEGYLDVIGMWQAGLKNVVASSGTALTDEQIALIHRFTKNVTLIYDGDEPGIKAAFRGMNMLLSHNLDVSVLLLPDGEDPDSFARKHSPEELRQYVDQHSTDVIHFKARVLIDRAQNDPQKRVAAIRSMVDTLAHIPDKVKREVYIQECSRIMRVSEDAISSATAEAYAVIKEKSKKEREMRKLNRDLDNGRITPQPLRNPSPTEQTVTVNPSLVQTPSKSIYNSKISVETNPLRPLEWKVIQYCLKYGYVNFCESLEQDNDGQGDEYKHYLTVVEFVKEELSNDDLAFSVPEFAHIFQLLLDLLPTFRNDLGDFQQKLAGDFEQKRNEGYEVIASKNLTIAEIQKEETKLDEKIRDEMQEEITRFSRSYPSRLLASHENDVVRTLTNEAILERHQLSQIYSREHPVESEEDKLFNLLPMAITVWKNGILDIQLKKLLSQFQEIAGKGQLEEERRIQAHLAEIIKLRSEFAKNIGDRIICPTSAQRK
ncbi:MAG: DNA primase [Muribaculaceae bacterium]|nr:DNA primase [Muribaculaceae bacterium]